MSLTLNHLDSSSTDFASQLDALIETAQSDAGLIQTVSEIINRVRADGDKALVEYTRRFQNAGVTDIASLIVTRVQMQEAADTIPAATARALQSAAERIRRYAEEQVLREWHITDSDDNVLGQKITPLDSVGLYIPGGKAFYPSSLLMTAIPAKVADVPRVVVVVPSAENTVSPLVLAVANLCGVDEMYVVGGAQAIAALAYGTETIGAVDKIVGPGNQYVAEAKRQVFGKVGIDMIAGPSEIIVVCDNSARPEWVAADLFAQAEHDEQARAILISPDEDIIEAVSDEMQKLIQKVPRADIIRQSLEDCGALIKVNNLEEAVVIVNRIAPEHLMLAVEEPQALLGKVRHAGAIFLGQHTPEVLGDYCAGPNHVLPTATAARFSSPLGVYDFQKRSSIIHCSPSGAGKLAAIAGYLADCEGLSAHASSALYRRQK